MVFPKPIIGWWNADRLKLKKILFFLLVSGAFCSSSFALSPQELERKVAQAESQEKNLIPGTEARVLLEASRKTQKTPWALLYLHGFSASPPEVSPVAENVAQALKAHLYMPRFRGHGLSTPKGLLEGNRKIWEAEAADHLEKSFSLGEKLLVIATSTGASWLIPALKAQRREGLYLVFLSPNLRLRPPLSSLLLWPGARLWVPWIMGQWREWKPDNALHGTLATTRYPSQVLVEVAQSAATASSALEQMQWHYPSLVIVNPNDPIVDARATRQAFSRWPKESSHWLEYTASENPHVLAGAMVSPSGTAPLTKAILDFVGNPLSTD
jgi:esterase/lipase